MNEFDKNFHINFSPLYFAFAVMMFMLWSSEVQGSDIEEVVVTAQQVETKKADPISSSRVISAIVSDFTYSPGGYGGFVGYNERGAQTIHTSVIVNGIPANDPGSGWYDFGHDFASGQTVKVVSGANGVLYGSGSIAGTVLIQDTIDTGALLRLEDGKEINYIRLAPIEQFELSYVADDMDSVRNDNDEEDEYTNTTARFNVDAGDFVLVGKFTDYEYDYDNCYAFDFSTSNDCVQDGERYSVSIRNDYITLGRNYSNSEYATNESITYTNESYRDFLRIGNSQELSKFADITYGIDVEKLAYNTDFFTSETESTVEKYTDDNYGAYISANIDLILSYNFGIRVGNDDQNALRLGIEKGPWYFNVGNSFRKPNLYEKFGDGYVNASPDLDSEEGVGYELGFGALSIYHYEFEQTILYQPAFATTIIIEPASIDPETGLEIPAVTEEVWTDPTYYNGGEYDTTGVRFANTLGPISWSFKYTDTEQPRVPKYSASIDYMQVVRDVNLRIKYAVNLDRVPSEFDVLPEGQNFLDDLHKVNFYATKKLENFVISFKIENLLDEEYEVVPFYPNQGREYYLTLAYNW